MSRRLLVPLALLAAGCMPAGYYRVEPRSGESALIVGDLQVRPDVELRFEPHKGWDLHASFDFLYAGQGRPRVDLSRAMVRVDGGPWENCDLPDDVDLERMIVVLQPTERVQHALVCEEVPHPYKSVDIRIPASGTGGGSTLLFELDGVQR